MAAALGSTKKFQHAVVKQGSRIASPRSLLKMRSSISFDLCANLMKGKGRKKSRTRGLRVWEKKVRIDLS